MKLVVSNPETGKTYQTELEKDKSKVLFGNKVNDVVKGDPFGLIGYELQITGGSDLQGFPMRADLHGTSRKRILLTHGPGYKAKRKGERMRKSVRGNTVSDQVAQVNLKVVKKGSEDLDKVLKKEEKVEKKK